MENLWEFYFYYFSNLSVSVWNYPKIKCLLKRRPVWNPFFPFSCTLGNSGYSLRTYFVPFVHFSEPKGEPSIQHIPQIQRSIWPREGFTLTALQQVTLGAEVTPLKECTVKCMEVKHALQKTSFLTIPVGDARAIGSPQRWPRKPHTKEQRKKTLCVFEFLL